MVDWGEPHLACGRRWDVAAQEPHRRRAGGVPADNCPLRWHFCRFFAAAGIVGLAAGAFGWFGSGTIEVAQKTAKAGRVRAGNYLWGLIAEAKPDHAYAAVIPSMSSDTHASLIVAPQKLVHPASRDALRQRSAENAATLMTLLRGHRALREQQVTNFTLQHLPEGKLTVRAETAGQAIHYTLNTHVPLAEIDRLGDVATNICNGLIVEAWSQTKRVGETPPALSRPGAQQAESDEDRRHLSMSNASLILQAVPANSTLREWGVTNFQLEGGDSDWLAVSAWMAGDRLRHGINLGKPLADVTNLAELVQTLGSGLCIQAHNTSVRLGYRVGVHPFQRISSQGRNPTMIDADPHYQTLAWHARMLGMCQIEPVEVDVSVDTDGQLHIVNRRRNASMTVPRPPESSEHVAELVNSLRTSLFP